MIKRLLLLLCLVVVSGCYRSGVTADPIMDDVKLLMEIDGCRVYRFWDAMHPVYFTNCTGRVEYETGGKSSLRIQNTTTGL